MLTVSFIITHAIASTRTWVRGRIDSERGASAVEYALLVGLIAAVVAAAVLALGGNVSHIFGNTSSSICTSGSDTGTCAPPA